MLKQYSVWDFEVYSCNDSGQTVTAMDMAASQYYIVYIHMYDINATCLPVKIFSKLFKGHIQVKQMNCHSQEWLQMKSYPTCNMCNMVQTLAIPKIFSAKCFSEKSVCVLNLTTNIYMTKSSLTKIHKKHFI